MADHGPRKTRSLARNIRLGLVVLLAAGLAWWVLASVRDLKHDLAQSRRDGQTLAQQVRQLGGTPAVTPQPGPAGSPGPSGQPGKIGPSGRSGRAPTQGEIAAAVSSYLQRHPPAKGRPPTMAEILTAVSGYLQQHPPAAGPAGMDGKDGRDGTDGKDGQDGASGPPPSDEQIRAAVETYLAAHPLNCPAGFHMATETIVTTGGPIETAICVSD